MKRLVITAMAAMFFPLFLGAQEIVDQVYYESGELQTAVFQVGEDFLLVNYYEDGKLKDKAVFTGTKRNGKFQSWHANGQKHLTGEFVDNKPNGNWKVWNENGDLIGSAQFQEGDLKTGSLMNEMGEVIATR